MLRLIESAPEPRMPPPAGALPCVWMSAGLVAYKLCDRGFECDGCPFDQAMRGARPAPAGVSGRSRFAAAAAVPATLRPAPPRAPGWDAPGWADPAPGVARRAAAGS